MRSKKELLKLAKIYAVLETGLEPLNEKEIEEILDRYNDFEGYELKIILKYLKGCYNKHIERIKDEETERQYKAMCAAHGCKC